MELSKKLYPRRYWKLEEILLLLFNRSESVEIERDFYVEENHTLFKSKFEKEISKAIKSGDLEEHTAWGGDYSDYLDRYEFSNWLLARDHKINIDKFVYGNSIESVFDDGLDYKAFIRAVHKGFLPSFTEDEAICYLARIPITKDREKWSNEEKEVAHKFKLHNKSKGAFTPQEIIAIADIGEIIVPDEMRIPIDEARIFNNQENAPKKAHDLKELIQSERLILFGESGIDPDTTKLWKRMKEVQHQDNVIDEVASGFIFWTSENLSERKPVSLKYFRKLVGQVKKEYPIS